MSSADDTDFPPPPPPVGSGPQGWVAGQPDSRDKYYKPDPTLTPRNRVNLRTEYPDAAVEVYDQLQTRTCVANASAAALWYELKKSKSDDMKPSGPSRLFIYYNARTTGPKATAATQLSDSGTYNRAAIKSIDKSGVCLESSWLFDSEKINEKPLQKCYTDGEKHSIAAYYRLDPDRPSDIAGESLDNDKDKTGVLLLKYLRHCLSEGFPVVFAFKYYWESIPWDTKEAIWSMPDIWADKTVSARHTYPTHSWGGHAVLAVGYDNQKQAVLCQNSWGINVDPWYSEGGLFWMPYAWITDYAATNDFWTIRSHKPPHGYQTLEQVSERVEQVRL